MITVTDVKPNQFLYHILISLIFIMITSDFLKLLLVLSLLFVKTSSSTTFSNVTFYSDSIPVEQSALTFTINFNLVRDLDAYEAVIIKLPRFKSESEYDHVEISPSNLIEGIWHNGVLDPTNHVYPYDESMLTIRPSSLASSGDGVFTQGSAVAITVFSSNKIQIHCGIAGSNDYSTIGYRSRVSSVVSSSILSVPSIASRVVYANGTLGSYTSDFVPFDVFPRVGEGCDDQDKCSGHGVCDYCNKKCICDEGFGNEGDTKFIGLQVTSSSCAYRTCPSGTAIGDLPIAFNQAHQVAECSNQGKCNRATGNCSCFAPFSGPACNELTCPSSVDGVECSGHGVCWNMAEIAADDEFGVTSYGSTALSQATVAWDYRVMKGCVCNSTSWDVGYGYGQYQLAEYYQPDCSLRRCPSGDNPFTCENEEDCYGKNQLNGVIKGEMGNKCHIECSGRGSCNHTTGECSCYIGSIGIACEQLAGGIFAPDCNPTSVPSSAPTLTYYPTAEPSGEPTSQPSSMPTKYLYLPSPLQTCETDSFIVGTTATINCTLDVRVLDHEALVYCGAFITGAYHNEAPSNADDVILQGHSALSLNGNATVVLKDLVPATVYDFYCASVSMVGTKSNAEQVLSSRMSNVTTECCKSLLVEMMTQSLVEGSFRDGGLSISVSAVPSYAFWVNVTVSLYSNVTTYVGVNSTSSNSTNSSSNVVALVPQASSNITLSSTQVEIVNGKSTIYYMDVAAALSSRGKYTVHVVAFGPSAFEYRTHYGNRILTVVDDSATPDTPALLSAMFSKDGGSLLVRFNSPTDRGNVQSAFFSCNNILEFVGASSSICKWVDDETISMTPSIQVLPDSNMTVATNTVKAKCVTGPEVPCSQWDFMEQHTNIVVILAPSSPVFPVVVATGPSSIGNCANLTLDLTSSIGSAGRDWLGPPVFEIVSTSAENTAGLLHHLNNEFRMFPPGSVNASYFEADKSYTFKITLCNFLKACGDTLYVLTIDISSVVPTVAILGSYAKTMYARDKLTLNTMAYITQCNGLSSFENLEFTWSFLPGGEELAEYEIPSSSSDPAKFYLSPYSLQPGTIYNAQVTAKDTSTGARSIAKAVVNVLQGKIVASIASGAVTSVALGSFLALDGTNSFDEDVGVGDGSAGLQYRWSCIQLAPVYSLVCPFSYHESNLAEPIFTVNASSVFDANAGTSAKITLAVSDSTYSRSSSAVVIVNTVQPDAPAIRLRGELIPSSVAIENRLALTAQIFSKHGCSANWSVNDTSLRLSDITYTGGVSNVDISPVKVSKIYLGLVKNVLSPRATYLFSLDCGGTVSSVIVNTNGPPQLGVFTVSPTQGTEIVSKFLFSADKWFDEDLPLMYIFGFVSTKTVFSVGSFNSSLDLFSRDTNFMTTRSLSEVTYGSAILPAGNSSIDFNISCGCFVYDALGSYSTSMTVVQVLPRVETTSNNMTAVEELLNSTLKASLSTTESSIDSTKQIIAAFSDIINYVNCSKAPPCASLNRNECNAISNTCGVCVAGYIGIEGYDNSECIRSDSVVTHNKILVGKTDTISVNRSCTTNEYCVSQLNFFYECDAYTRQCAIRQKRCVNNCTSSSHGKCYYTKASNKKAILDECGENNLNCVARCQCFGGYGGADCSLTSQEVTASRNVRATLIEGLKTLTDTEVPSATVVNSWVSSLSSLSKDPTALTPAAGNELMYAAKNAVKSAKQLKMSFDDIQKALVTVDDVDVAISNTDDLLYTEDYEKHVNATYEVINTCSDVLVSQMLPSEDVFSSVYRTFRMVASANDVDTNSSRTIVSELPVTAIEQLLGTEAASMSIPSDSLSATAYAHSTGAIESSVGTINTIRISVVSLDASLFGNESGYTANPISAQISSSDVSSDFPLPKPIVTVKTQNVEAELYTPTLSNISYTTICLPLIPAVYTFECPNAPNVTHVCTGINTILTTNCSQVVPTPFCANVLGSSSQNGTNCNVTESTDMSTTCSCPLYTDANVTVESFQRKGRRLALTGGDNDPLISYLPISTVNHDIITESPENYSNMEYLEIRSFAVYTLYATIWIVALVGGIYVYSGFSDESKTGDCEKDEDAALVKEEDDIAVYVNNLFPSVFLTNNHTARERMSIELWKHHKLLRSLVPPRSEEEKVKILWSMCHILSLVSTTMGVLAVLYDLDNPVDDGSCRPIRDESKCTERHSIFNSDKTYCIWREETVGPVTDHVCTYQPVSFNVHTLLYISIIAVVVCGIIDGALEIIFRIAYAPVIQNESGAIRSIQEFARKSMTRLSINKTAPAAEKGRGDAAVVKEATEIQAAAVKRRTRRASTTTIAVSDDMLNRRNSLAELALTAAPAMQKELHRRSSVRNSLRMSISGAINIAGGFRFALQPLFDYDEFVGDINCQYNMFKTERERSDFLRVWRLPPNDVVEDGTCTIQRSCIIPPKTEERIKNYLTDLKVEAAAKFAELQGARDSQIAVETIRLFVLDLLGKDTDAARIFLVKAEEDSGQVFEVSYDAKKLAIAALTLLNAACIGFVMWQASIHELRWQTAYIIASLLHCFFAITIMEASAVIFCNFAIPVQVSDDIQKAYELILKLSRSFSENAMNPAPPNPYDAPVVMDAPGYLFLSFKVARKNIRMLESLIILSYDSYFPGSIARKWDPAVCDEFDTTGLSARQAFELKWRQYRQMLNLRMMMKFFGSLQMKNQLLLTKAIQTVFYCILLLFALLFATNFLMAEILVPIFAVMGVSLYYNRCFDELTVVKAFRSRYTIVPEKTAASVETIDAVERPVYDEEWLSRFHRSGSSSDSSDSSDSSGSSDESSDSESEESNSNDSEESSIYDSSLSTDERIDQEDIVLSEEDDESEEEDEEEWGQGSVFRQGSSTFRYPGSLLESLNDNTSVDGVSGVNGVLAESDGGIAVEKYSSSSTVKQEDSYETIPENVSPAVTTLRPLRKPPVAVGLGFASPKLPASNPSDLHQRIGFLNRIHSGVTVEHNTPLSPSRAGQVLLSDANISLSDDSFDSEEDESYRSSENHSSSAEFNSASNDTNNGPESVDGTNRWRVEHDAPDLDVSYVDNV